MKPNVGMLHPVAARVATYTKGSAITYSAGAVIAEARGATLTWNRADGHFYGDDVELDTDNSILGYTIEFEPSGLTDAARALLLGEVAGTGSEYTITDANAPDVGFGYVRVMREEDSTTGGVKVTYEGWWFHKVKFAVNNEETRTKEQNIEWRTPTLTGTGTGVSLSSSGEITFAKHKSFDTAAAAIAYVNTEAGIT